MKIFLDTVGCRLNQSEIEHMAARFRDEGHEVVASAAEADLMVINTCTVTAAADADSRKKIRQAARSGVNQIIATGCYATLQPERISQLPGVELVVANSRKEMLVEDALGTAFSQSKKILSRIPLPGQRKRTRAFIKVQDGCDNHCTFCITRIARGKSVSRTMKEVFADVEFALAGGVKEIVLTGVNLGAWGKDLSAFSSLGALMRELISRYSPPRLRLSSLEPWDVNNEMIDAMQLPGVCRHLHLPLQSGCDEILQKMGRRTDMQTYKETVGKIRKKIPEVAVTTDIMVGFPGETESHFQKSLEFVQRMAFTSGHVFRYSPRPGTPAAKLPDRIEAHVCKTRNRQMRELFTRLETNHQRKQLGQVLEVLWEKSEPSPAGWQLSGLSENFLRVAALADRNAYNEISGVRVESIKNKKLFGEVLE